MLHCLRRYYTVGSSSTGLVSTVCVLPFPVFLCSESKCSHLVFVPSYLCYSVFTFLSFSVYLHSFCPCVRVTWIILYINKGLSYLILTTLLSQSHALLLILSKIKFKFDFIVTSKL